MKKNMFRKVISLVIALLMMMPAMPSNVVSAESPFKSNILMGEDIETVKDQENLNEKQNILKTTESAIEGIIAPMADSALPGTIYNWPSDPTFTASPNVYIYPEDFYLLRSTNKQSVVYVMWSDSSNNLFMAVSVHENHSPKVLEDVVFEGNIISTDFKPYISNILHVNGVSYDANNVTSDNAGHRWIIVYLKNTSPKNEFSFKFDTGTGHAILDASIVIQKALTLTKTASPTTYNAVGNVINYSYVIKNTGNVTLSGPFTINDNKLSVSVPSTASLTSGAEIIATANHTIDQGDIDNGSITNTAYTTGNYVVNDNVIPVISDSVSAKVTAERTRALSLNKFASSMTYDSIGDIISYSFTVTNTGNVTLYNILVTDANPEVTVTGTQIESLEPGASNTTNYSATYEITQADMDAGEYTNIATATGYELDGTEVSATDDATVTSASNVEIAITKTADPEIYDAVGDVIDYTIEVTNPGNRVLTGVTVSDPMLSDTNLVLVTGDIDSDGKLDVGETWTYEGSYTIDQDDLDAGSVVNTATADSNETGPELDSATVTVVDNYAVAITKTADPEIYDAVGDVIDYTIEVTNPGNRVLTGVIVSDPMLSDTNLVLVTGDIDSDGKLDVGETWTYEGSYTIDQDDLDAGSVVNTATADSNETGPELDSATVTVVDNYAVAITKTADPEIYDAVGDVIDYTIEVTNPGNRVLTGVTVSDPMLSDTNLVLVTGDIDSDGKLDVGETWTYEGSYTIDQDDLDAGSVVNTATADSNETGPELDSATVTVVDNYAVAITKTADPEIYDAVGDVIDYTIEVTNPGNRVLTGVTVSDPMLSDTNLVLVTGDIDSDGKLDVGETWTYEGSYTIDQDDLDAGSVVNTATADSNETGPELDSATVTVVDNYAVAITKTADPEIYDAVGDVIDYTIEVTNPGNRVLTGVTVSDPMLSDTNLVLVTGDIDLDGKLDVGETWTYEGSYTIDQDDLDAGSVVNTATADSNETGPELDSATVTVVDNYAVAITKTADPEIYDAVGDVIDYTIEVTNPGNRVLTGVTVSDPMLSDTNLVLVTGDIDSDGKLDVGETWTYEGSYTIDQDDLDAGSVVNTATADSNETGPELDSATVTVVDNYAVAITKTADPEIYDAVGDVIDYTIEVTNPGNRVLTGVTVSDPMLSDTNLVLVTGDIDLDGKLDVGETWTYEGSYTIDQDDLDAGSVVNTATADSNETGPELDSATVTVVDNYAVAITKTADPEIYDAVGDVIDYTIEVTNPGNRVLTGVTVSDPMLSDTNLVLVTGDIDSDGKLDVGETWTYEGSYTIDQDDLDAGSVVNTATADSNETGPELDSATVTVVDNYAVAITKTADPEIYDAVGDVIDYTIEVTNPGNRVLTGVTVSDPMLSDTNLVLVTGDIDSDGKLDVGETWTYEGSYTIDQDDLDAGSVVNTATADSNETDSEIATKTVYANQDAAIEIVKSVKAETPSTYDAENDVITYSFIVTNTGNVTLTNIAVTDPDATVTGGPIANLAPGASDTTTFEATHVITQEEVDEGSFTNTATVTGTTPEGYKVDDVLVLTVSDTDTETVSAEQSASIEIIKTVKAETPSTYDAENDVITYSFTVTNTGNVTLTNIVVADLDATVTGDPIASLAPGASDTTTFEATHVITQEEVDEGSFTNTATVTGTTPEGYKVDDVLVLTVSDTDTETVSAEQSASIEIIKTVKAETPSTYDAENDVITYSFTVTNTGNVTLTNIAVTDPDATVTGGPIASLAPGASDTTTFEATYIITQEEVDEGSFTNTATVTGTTPEGYKADDVLVLTVSDTDTETVTAEQSASIEIIKTVKAETPSTYDAENDVITYSFTVTNTGNVTLTNIAVTDPDATVTGGPIANLAPGASDTTTFEATHVITQEEVDEGSFTNTATVTGTTPEGYKVDDVLVLTVSDTDTETVTAEQSASIEIIKTVKAETPSTYDAENDVITYSFTVTNTGNVTLTNIAVTDPDATVTGGPIANLAPGASDTTTFEATYIITQEEVDEGSFTNTATVTGTTPEGYKVDDVLVLTVSDTDTETVSAEQSASIEIIKTVKAETPSTYDAKDDVITYSFTVTNTGNVTLTNIAVTDPDATVTGGPIASLAPGASDTTTFEATHIITQEEVDEGSFTNTATVTGTTPEGYKVDDVLVLTVSDTGTETVTAEQSPDLKNIKEGSWTDKNQDGFANVGELINYKIKVENVGNITITGLKVTDPMFGEAPLELISGDVNENSKLDVRETWLFTASYLITSADIKAGMVTNVALIVSNQTPEEKVTELIPLTEGFVVLYEPNGGSGSLIDVKNPYGSGENVTVLSNTNAFTRSNYRFTGWNTAANGTGTSYAAGDTFTMPASDVTLYAQWSRRSDPPDIDIPDTDPPLADLEKFDHFAYVIGYPDGEVKPGNDITREEVAMIFYRLLTDESRNSLLSDVNQFTDITTDRWSNRAISTLYNGGIIKGYPDGTFKPSEPITRAEFATIAAKFDKLELQDTTKFTDIFGHWAEKYITSSEIKGWIKGYPDLTFKPEQDITRAESMTLINNVLDRLVPEENIHPDAMFWPDMTSDDWYYEAVMEATNSHNYIYEEDKDELWTGMKPNKVWP